MVVSVPFLVVYFLWIFLATMYQDGGSTASERAEGFGFYVVRFFVLVVLALIPFHFVMIRGPTPAIYEMGVQVRGGRFVPFTAIFATHVVIKRVTSNSGQLIIVPNLSDLPPGIDHLSTWVVPMTIIGGEGRALIEMKVRRLKIADHPTIGPPSPPHP